MTDSTMGRAACVFCGVPTSERHWRGVRVCPSCMRAWVWPVYAWRARWIAAGLVVALGLWCAWAEANALWAGIWLGLGLIVRPSYPKPPGSPKMARAGRDPP